MARPLLPRLPLTRRALANGAQGMVARDRSLTNGHLCITIAAGYLDEPVAWPGLAHLLEHAITTTPLADGSHGLVMWCAEQGGTLNARTDDYLTDIHVSLPPPVLADVAHHIAAQMAAPTLRTDVLAREIAAIDAEWRARKHSAGLQRLKALAALASPRQFGSGCRHGNAATLGGNIEALREALLRFHRRHFHAGRLSMALLGPWEHRRMLDLLEGMAARFSPAPDDAPPLAMMPRWRTDRRAAPAPDGAPTTLLWPLPAPLSQARWARLAELAHAMNQGECLAHLPAGVSDYRATLSPSGAMDTFCMTLEGRVPPADGERFATWLSGRLNALAKAPDSASSPGWQPPSGTLKLGPAWFDWARQQALATRLTACNGQARPAAFTPSGAYWLTATRRDRTRPVTEPTNDTPPVERQHWSGVYGVCHDAAALANTPWAACFFPHMALCLAPLATQRLAQAGITLLRGEWGQGSWLMTVGNDAVSGMLRTLAHAQPVPAETPNTLLAQRLLQRLTTAPDRPAIWTSHAAALPSLDEAVVTLARRVAARFWTRSPTPRSASPTDDAPLSVAIMRTLRLPGTPEQRWQLARAEQQHRAAFFRQAREVAALGYVAAVRCGDGAPCSLGYVVQTTGGCEADAAARAVRTITQALWDVGIAPSRATPATPETAFAALVSQWQCLLSGADTPLHRLPDTAASNSAAGRWHTHWLDSAGRYWISD